MNKSKQLATLFVLLIQAVLGADELPPVDRKIDFARDVAPILQNHCVDCHGPNLELGSLRLDDKKLALAGEIIEPGNSAESLLIKRLARNDKLGIRMPPTGPALKDEQIGILKTWIDQGAQWPDKIHLASASAANPDDTRLAAVFKAIRKADARQLQQLVRNSELAQASRADGMTPLIFAAQFSTPAIVDLLLKRGADPNAATKDGLNALMAGAASFEKTRLLLRHGAEPKAKTGFRLSVVDIAAGEPGNAKTVKLLLDGGAKLAPSALATAASIGDADTLDLLIQCGADINFDNGAALEAAAKAGHVRIMKQLLAAGAHATNHAGAVRDAAIHGHREAVELLVTRGAEVNRPGGLDRYSSLMQAADSDYLPVEVVQFLLRNGADPTYKSPANGETALSLARKRGRTAVVEALEAGGTGEAVASDATPSAPSKSPGPVPDARAAVEKSLALLQKTGPRFFKNTGCISCHHQLVTSMAIGLAREKGLRVSEELASTQRKTAEIVLNANRASYLQGRSLPGGHDTTSYILAGLADEGFPPNEATDAMAVYLMRQQAADGSWKPLTHRPPSEYSAIAITAYNVYALQAYAPPGLRKEAREKISRARDWLTKSRPTSVQEHASRLLGLKWTGARRGQIHIQAKALVELQQPDGGWAQLPTLPKDAYATGLALFALNRGGDLPPDNDVYKRGVEFLLQTQQADGSWFVKSRAHGFQPYFESGFPYEHDQWISAHGTGLAAMSMMITLPSVGPNPGLLASIKSRLHNELKP